MPVEEIYGEELSRIRAQCQENGTFSWTSPQYQSDLLNFINDHRKHGHAVVEVGCYKGGLSALLALLCSRNGQHLFTMDIDPTAVASTNDVLDRCGVHGCATVFHGGLAAFAASGLLTSTPVLCILDGDHAYDAVKLDLEAVNLLSHRPYALAFHDYSLRHPTTDERVDEAVRDFWNGKVTPRPIGLRMNGQGHPTREAPQPDGHYWEVPGSEGALAIL